MMTTRDFFNLIAFAGLGAFGAVHAQSNNPYASPHPTPTPATQAKGSQMDDLKSFATDGTRILDSQTGDLTGDGRKDVLLVLEQTPTGKEKLGEGPSRNVLVLVRDAEGRLQKAASNSRIVPCATCGGVAGDPYGYAHVASGQFTVVNGGGSRERWSAEYTFTYAADKKDWYVTKVSRSVSDTETEKEKRVELTASELGTVSFRDFDPAKLPEVTLP